MLNFEAALRILRNEGKVKRLSWDDDCYIKIYKGSIVYCYDTTASSEWIPTDKDILAQDWRVKI